MLRISIFALTLICAGCATSTVETRKQEKYSAYSSLDPEVRQLVDEGRIRVGMPMDAVYIAWGPPSQILHGESDKGSLATWQFFGTEWEERRYWTYRTYFHRGRYISEPYLDFDYQPRNYISAEVVFENGVVKTWNRLNR